MDDKFSVNLLCRGQSLTWAGSRLCLKYSIFLCQSVALQLKTNLRFYFSVQQFFFGPIASKGQPTITKGNSLRLTNSFNSYWRQKEQKDTLLISELSPSTTLRFSLSAKVSLLANQSHQKGPFLTLRAQCLTISRPPHICLSLSSFTLSLCILHSYVFSVLCLWSVVRQWSTLSVHLAAVVSVVLPPLVIEPVSLLPPSASATQLTHNDIPQPVSNLDSRPQLFHLAYFLADWPNFLHVLRKFWPYKQGTTDKSAIKICSLKNTRPRASWLRCALQGDEAVRRDSYGAAIVGTQYWVTIWLYQLIIAGTGSVYGDIGWYLVVVGQYRVVLVDTWY